MLQCIPLTMVASVSAQHLDGRGNGRALNMCVQVWMTLDKIVVSAARSPLQAAAVGVGEIHGLWVPRECDGAPDLAAALLLLGC